MSKIEYDRQETAFRLYVAKGVRVLTENTANAFGGKTLSLDLSEVLVPQKEETRTAQEIIEHMKEKLRKAGES